MRRQRTRPPPFPAPPAPPRPTGWRRPRPARSPTTPARPRRRPPAGGLVRPFRVARNQHAAPNA
ncbi:Protein of unknown function, partial [Gryllus bimaculatus]